MKKIYAMVTMFALGAQLFSAAAFAAEDVPEYMSSENMLISTADESAQNVAWAIENGIIAEDGSDDFDADGVCTRAQAITLLWKAAGSPESNEEIPFGDVSADGFYAEALKWAAEKGITNGTGDNMFEPDASCTRSQIACFIYRYVRSNGSGFTGAWMFRMPFTDLEEWCYEDIAWCYMKNIMSGISDDSFGLSEICTGAEIVTFIKNAVSE